MSMRNRAIVSACLVGQITPGPLTMRYLGPEKNCIKVNFALSEYSLNAILTTSAYYSLSAKIRTK